MLKITSIAEVNRKISQESLRSILKHSDELKEYTDKNTLQDMILYILDDFEEEVRIGTFHDINNYIEYFIEMIRES